MSVSKRTIALPSAVAAAAIIIALGGGGVFPAINAQQTMGTTFTVQKTAMSTVDTLPGHEHHQAVVVLPARNDSKIWVGTITWTSSKPVEVRILQNYNSSIAPDPEHGTPSIAPFGKGQAAISLIKPFNSGAEAPSFNSGSMNFVGNQVAFHTIDGTKFTVTYSVDAVAKNMTG